MGRAALAVGVTFALALALAPELARRIEIGWLTCTSLLDEDADFVTASADRKVTDYAVVLGYALESDGAPTETLKERVRAGVALYLQGKTKRLLFSGGHPGGGTERRGNKSEAQVMATYATEIMKELEEEEEERRGSEGGGGGNKNLGNWNDFELEEKSTSTRTNALFSIRQIEESLFSGKHAAGQEAGEGERGREREGGRVAIVTSPWHQLRSKHTFEVAAGRGKKKLEFVVAKVGGEGKRTAKDKDKDDDDGVEKKSRAFLAKAIAVYDRTFNVFREVAAIAYYKVNGWV